MGQLPGEESSEELLGSGSSRQTVAIVVLVGALLGAAIVAYLVTHKRATSPTAQPTTSATPGIGTASPVAANDVLVPGSSSESTVDNTARRVGLTAELVNLSQADLTVIYPIRMPGGRQTAATVLYAEVAPSGTRTGSRPPPRLTQIAAGEHVVLWIGLHIRCVQRVDRSTWPTARSTLAISLEGFVAPAVFSFGELFDPDVMAQINRMCVHR